LLGVIKKQRKAPLFYTLGLTHWVDVVRAKPAPHLPQS